MKPYSLKKTKNVAALCLKLDYCFFYREYLKTNPRHDEDLKDYMISQGYRLETVVTAKWNMANDYIFVKENFVN